MPIRKMPQKNYCARADTKKDNGPSSIDEPHDQWKTKSKNSRRARRFFQNKFEWKPREDNQDQRERIEHKKHDAAGGESHSAVKARVKRITMSDDDSDPGKRDSPLICRNRARQLNRNNRFCAIADERE